MKQIHERHIDDTATVIPAVLSKKNSAGVDTVTNLTGKTVTFKLVDEYGTEVLAATSATVTDATAGEVEYDFSSEDVDTAGTFYGYFIVDESGEDDHYPAVRGDLVVTIHGD